MNQRQRLFAARCCYVTAVIFVTLAILAFVGGLAFNFVHVKVQVMGKAQSLGDVFGAAFWPMILLCVGAIYSSRRLCPVKQEITSDWRTDLRRE